jgi:hypothetical protein
MLNLFRKKDLNEAEFWKIISKLDWRHSGDDQKVLESAVVHLASKSNKYIESFQEMLSEFLFKLDGVAYAQNIGDESYVGKESYFSVDSFLYARCVVIANGKDYYYKVLNDPLEMPKDLEFEMILYLAPTAYRKKNNRELDLLLKFDFETYSNKEQW